MQLKNLAGIQQKCTIDTESFKILYRNQSAAF